MSYVLEQPGGLHKNEIAHYQSQKLNCQTMTTVITRPSFLLSSIRVEKVENFHLFKFNDELQVRMEELLERKKADLLTKEEAIELEAIGELDRIFTHINAMLVAQA